MITSEAMQTTILLFKKVIFVRSCKLQKKDEQVILVNSLRVERSIFSLKPKLNKHLMEFLYRRR
jgi:hypothetical protein